MKKYLLCFIIFGLLCTLFAGCAVNTAFKPEGYKDFRNELKDTYACVDSISFKVGLQSNILSVECKLDIKSKLSEILGVYHAITDYLSDEKVLNAYFTEIKTEYSPTPPPSPIISVNPGPRIDLYLNIGQQRIQISVRAAKMQNTRDGAVYVYNGFPGWEKLNFHRENLTSNHASTGELSTAEIVATADFDTDGTNEDIILTGTSTEPNLVLLERDNGQTFARELLNDELCKLVAGFAEVDFLNPDALKIQIPYFSFDIPKEFYSNVDNLEVQMEIDKFEVSDLTIFAYARVYVYDPLQNMREPVGTAEIPLYYDDELGLRAGTPLELPN